MKILNKIIKYGRDKKEQKEIDILINYLYNKMFMLSNLNRKDFLKIMNDFLKQYDNLKFLSEDNTMFVLEGDKYRKLNRKEKLKFLFPNEKD